MLQTMRSAAKYIWWFIVIAFLIGFVFLGQSGLGDRGKLTRGTTVAKINGQTITYDQWLRASQNAIRQQQEQNNGKSLTLDEERRIEDETFNQMVNEILLNQEYARRGITVTPEEIQQVALSSPPPQLAQSPDFQTEGRFDFDKYRRFITSPAARQQGVLQFLEEYYRSEIPREKLFEQIATAVYVPDAQLWRVYQDAHDSAQVSFVALDPASIPDSAVKVSDADIQKYFDAHKDDFGDRPGRAVLSVTMIPRIPTAADTAAARAKAVAVRNEIVGGAKFEDVAKRESADSASAAQGGSLGKTTKGQFVKAFEDAAYALKPGEISQPVLTPFGFHIIRVDEHKGDTISARHVLIPIQQSDSSASASDRLADALAKAAGSEKPAIFDSVTKALGLKVGHVVAIENEPLVWNGNYVPSLSAWAFGGARPGETSDLVDDDRGYYLGRLDSLQAGWSKTSGSQSDKAKLAAFRDDIRRELVREKKLDLLIPKAKQITSAVNAGQTLAQAAQSVGATVQQSPMFTRTTPVAGLGQASEAIGAAFGLPVGAVSAPIKTRTNVVVEKVDRRVPADRAAWEKQKDAQRQQYVQRLRQQRVQDFMASLRETAKIEDHRKEIQAESRQASS